MMKQFFGISLASMALAAASQAAVVVTSSNQTGPGTGLFTPTFTPSSTDLINGLSPSTSSGDFMLEASDGTPALTNGVYPPLSTGTVGSHAGLATAGNGNGSGTQVTYLFSSSNIDRVNIYGGWNDAGRDEQNFSIQFSSDGGTTFGAAILSGSFNPIFTDVAPRPQTATLVSISDNAGPLATGVNAIRVNFLAVENGHTGYAEIDVIAVPEPGSFAMLGLATVGLAARRRRRA